MRHFAEVGDDRFAADVRAEDDGQRRAFFLVLRRFEYAAQRYHFAFAVRDFQADEGAAGDDFHHAHALYREQAGDVALQVGDGADFDAGREREFDAGDDRADDDVLDAHAQFVVFQRLFDLHRHFVQLFVAVIGDSGGAGVEQVQRGQLVGFFDAVRCGERHAARGNCGCARAGSVVQAHAQLRFVARFGRRFGRVRSKRRRIIFFFQRGKIVVRDVQIAVVSRIIGGSGWPRRLIAQGQAFALAAGKVITLGAVIAGVIIHWRRGFRLRRDLCLVMRPADVRLAALRRFVRFMPWRRAEWRQIVLICRIKSGGRCLKHRRVLRARFSGTARFVFRNCCQQAVAQCCTGARQGRGFTRCRRAIRIRINFRLRRERAAFWRIRRLWRFARMAIDFAPQPRIGIDPALADPFQNAQPAHLQQQGDADEKQQGINAHHQLHRPHAQEFDRHLLPDDTAAGDGKRIDDRGGMQRQNPAQRNDRNHQGKCFPAHQLRIQLGAAHTLPADSTETERQQIRGVTEQ